MNITSSFEGVFDDGWLLTTSIASLRNAVTLLRRELGLLKDYKAQVIPT
jgi:hypothetical protein